jgi:hypothetical protein
MTAHALATKFLGRALEPEKLGMTEQDGTRLFVLTNGVEASCALQAMTAGLGIQLVTVTSFHELPFRLHHHRPIAVVFELDPLSHACRSGLRSIAAYDPDMPVLLEVGSDPATLGAIDVAEQLWGLGSIYRLPGAPAPADLIGFVFQAERQRGIGHLMPLA